jgi:uncharacterized protein (DUF983 family)
MKKGSKFYSIYKLKCPKCQIGDLFSKPGFFVYRNSLKMPDKCPHCGQDFIIEPGFYSATLWISYPILLVIIIPTIILGLSLKDIKFFFKIITPGIIIILFLLQVPLMRISRAILLNLSVPYRTEYKDSEHQEKNT